MANVLKPEEIAPYIDHTLLKPDAMPKDIEQLCKEAAQYRFATVCVNPVFVARAADLLKGSSTQPIAVIGFPLGASRSRVKCFEAEQAIQDGAKEIDMVIWSGALKAGQDQNVLTDIQGVVRACAPVPVKVIIETALLNEEQKIRACQISQQAGAHFVKTSTGFLGGGATVEDVRLMRKIVGESMGVKASGGIRDFKAAQAMIEAGANRLGTSSGVAILSHSQGSGY